MDAAKASGGQRGTEPSKAKNRKTSEIVVARGVSSSVIGAQIISRRIEGRRIVCRSGYDLT